MAEATPDTSRKLYGYALSSNSVRIAALLNEKGLNYELVAVDLDNKTPEFLAISVRTYPHFF
jgi:glutathione S-transferase